VRAADVMLVVLMTFSVMTYQETPGYHNGFFDPARMCVPRYQNLFRIFVWFFFLGVYSQAGKPQLADSWCHN
jgi:hypothetical protein